MKVGRKTKYTPERVEKILQAIRLGATYKIACAYAGINPDTFYEWLKRHPEFADAVKQAEGVGAIGWLEKIERAANDGEWTAAAWKLERRYPDDYGRRVQDTRISGPGGGPIQVETYDYGAAAAELSRPGAAQIDAPRDTGDETDDE